MNKILNYLVKNIFKIVVIYFVCQVLLVIFWQVPFTSDSQYYFKLAQDCLRYHSFYPAKAHLYEDYIIAPLYVNLIVVALSILNSQLTIGFLNIILNAVQMLLFFKIAEKLTDRNTAVVSVLLYIFYLNTLGMVLMNLTEYLFGILILSAILLFFKDSVKYFFLAGMFTAAAIAVRPLGWGLAIAFIATLVFRVYRQTNMWKELSAVVFGIVFFIIAYGTINQIYFGNFIYTSTSGPVNLIIGANDDATGAYTNMVFNPGKAGYIENSNAKTYIEKENYWEQRTKSWILSHPVKWLSLLPNKIFFMFITDDFSVPYLSHMEGMYPPVLAKVIVQGKVKQEFYQRPFYLIILYFIILIVNFIYYLSIILIFLMRIIKEKTFNLFSYKYLPVTLFIIWGLLITLAAYGDARYKYPYMLFIILFISQPVSRYLAGSKPFFNKA